MSRYTSVPVSTTTKGFPPPGVSAHCAIAGAERLACKAISKSCDARASALNGAEDGSTVAECPAARSICTQRRAVCALPSNTEPAAAPAEELATLSVGLTEGLTIKQFMTNADFRTASASQLAVLLAQVRQRSLTQFDRLFASLTPSYVVPQGPTLNPLLWELGHVGWFQTWWISRNPQRQLGAQARPDAPRQPPAFAQADAWFNSSLIPHSARWQLALPDLETTQATLKAGLTETLDLLSPSDESDDALYFFRLAYAHEAMHAEAFCMMASEMGLLESAPLLVPPSARLPITANVLPPQRQPAGFAFDNELGVPKVPFFETNIDSAMVKWDVYAMFLEATERYGEAAVARSKPAEAAATHMNFFDAQACAAWMGRRLPTEHEWQAAATQHPAAFHWGGAWEWTSSAFTPFAGFRAHPYRDYSQPWFETHQVLKGASAWTEPAMQHTSYRNFYLPQRQDMLCGFRTVAL
jgi:gamma-glutamyl hercynylcysteine S-oxide synthase